MTNRESCSHCHTVNDISVSRFCMSCGHNTVQPRVLCDCPRCYGELIEPPKLLRVREAATRAPCEHCDGTGTHFHTDMETTCGPCNGTGTVSK